MTATALLGHLETGIALFNDRVLVVFRWLAIGLLVSMLAIVDVAVFMRYVVNDALSWSEEIAKFVMVWLTFVVAPLGLRTGAHVGIGVLIGNLGGRGRQLLLIMIFLAIISLMIVIMKEGSFMAWNARIQRASTIDVSILYVYICMPIGAFMVAMVALEFLVNAMRGVIDPSQARSEGTDDAAQAND